ncbi:hypothetical protein RJ640_002651 [Escallonia rubra]|uniref:PUM-HD domain-containing protein n=1 Tax=Escallonia rubra TaxID=112253 RepID=A0AA88QP16_9ASTE|nr:hypothetical protein RJ640_002651 [Escallonia rubra]
MEDQHGHHLFQRHLEGSTGNELELIVNQVASLNQDKLLSLAIDTQGNYVVQHVLKLQNQELTDKICNKLRGHYTDLSSKKDGSHVVKKWMTSSIKGMKYAVEEFLENGRSLGQLARDQYGNYVIQRALKTTKVIFPFSNSTH